MFGKSIDEDGTRKELLKNGKFQLIEIDGVW